MLEITFNDFVDEHDSNDRFYTNRSSRRKMPEAIRTLHRKSRSPLLKDTILLKAVRERDTIRIIVVTTHGSPVVVLTV